MNGLKEKIQQDLKTALKGKREFDLSVLRMIVAVFQNREKEKRFSLVKEKPDLKEEELNEQSQLSDEEIVKIIFSEIKKRKEAITDYEKGKRQDLADKERKEIDILSDYLPEQISEEEMRKLVKEVIDKIGAKEIKDMGEVMKEIFFQAKGKADMGQISQMVREFLS